MHLETKLLHGYPVVDPTTGAASIPKYQTSTFHQNDVMNHKGYSYTRFGNPTITAAEKCIAALEDAKYGLAYASGMAAISAVLLLLSKGDHLVLGQNIYGGTYQAVTELLPRFGISATFVDETDPKAWQKAIQSNTKLFFLETPSNPLLTITDLAAVSDIAKKHHILTACDNTFMTPTAQHPLALGVDIVIHSATKFINGHSDVVGGPIATNHEDYYQRLKTLQKVLGGILSVEDAWLLLRGVKTLSLRMEKSVANAEKIAQHLQAKPEVKAVYYPGLSSHPQHQLQQQQATNGGAVLSFAVENKDQVQALFDRCRLPIVAVSLGGVESILSYPWLMSHACMPEDDRLKAGVTPTLLRLSCGIESADDLIADIDQALA